MKEKIITYILASRRMLLKQGCAKDLQLMCLTLCLMVASQIPETRICIIERKFTQGIAGHAIIIWNEMFFDGTATQFSKKYKAVEIHKLKNFKSKHWYWDFINSKTYTYYEAKRKFGKYGRV